MRLFPFLQQVLYSDIFIIRYDTWFVPFLEQVL